MTCQSILPRLLSDRAFRNAFMREQLALHIVLSLRANREARGWTQEQLAARIGTSPSVISRAENLDSVLHIAVQTLLRIAKALDVALLIQFSGWPEFLAAMKDVEAVAPFDAIEFAT